MIEQVAEEMDESAPSGFARSTPSFEISEENWIEAHLDPDDIYDQQTELYETETKSLRLLAIAAAKGSVKTYAWNGDGEVAISKDRWNVSDATLRSRYHTLELEPIKASTIASRSIIVVDARDIAVLIDKSISEFEMKKQKIRMRLLEAKNNGNPYTPHGNLESKYPRGAKFG